MTHFGRFALIAATAMGLAACASDPDPATLAGADGGAGGAYGSGAGGGALDPNSVEYFNVSVGDRVFFDTDSAAIDAVARDTLTRQAAWLAANPAVTVTIEGHADERGTRDYNLALGARRAQSARDFLLTQGVPASRLRTVSYGKERPVALGSDAGSWAQNRRAVTVVAGAPLS
ncbi:MAG: peptidoglycan-associated lipoprotein [Rhodobacterales bacterium CG18_big_fil_WC_8_21_14_2_50_71_9]|nr:MAG: peptidoglycan-associated lipoprotein [Rhodobacterales bacterium CG18_big_fil_WC_8_21_14_2_50_71_9]